MTTGENAAMQSLRSLSALLALLLVMPTGAAAQATNAIHLHFENDHFRNTEEYYTNGLRLAWVGDAVPLHARVLRMDRVFRCLRGEASCYTVGGGYAAGQVLFSPNDLSRTEPDVLDRPYGAWMYFSFLVQARMLGEGELPARPVDRLRDMELQVGWTGEPALGEPVQKAIHDLTGAPEPQGWEHQVPFQPGVIFTYRTRFRLAEHELPKAGRWIDLIPRYSLSLGSIMAGGAGATVRLGWNLQQDFGIPHIVPVTFGETMPTADFHLFWDWEWRYMGYNVFLDGPFGAESHSVKRKVGVTDRSLGATFRYRSARLSYQAIGRSPEFARDRKEHLYGTVSLILYF